MKLYLIHMHGCFHVVFEAEAKKFELLGSAKQRSEIISKLHAKGISQHACHWAAPSTKPYNWLELHLSINNKWNLIYEPLNVTPDLYKALEAPCKLVAPADSWHIEKVGRGFRVVRDLPQVHEQGEFEINWGGDMAPTFSPRRHEPNHFSIL